MEKIYSTTDEKVLLHLIVRLDEIEKGRKDVIPDNEFLQLSTLNLEKGKTFKPHKHIWKNSPTSEVIAQESWVVLRGSVKCIFYDLDDSIITERTLNSGDCSITLRGGHNYVILEEGTLVLEYKTGPYQGQELDKTFI